MKLNDVNESFEEMLKYFTYSIFESNKVGWRDNEIVVCEWKM